MHKSFPVLVLLNCSYAVWCNGNQKKRFEIFGLTEMTTLERVLVFYQNGVRVFASLFLTRLRMRLNVGFGTKTFKSCRQRCKSFSWNCPMKKHHRDCATTFCTRCTTSNSTTGCCSIATAAPTRCSGLSTTACRRWRRSVRRLTSSSGSGSASTARRCAPRCPRPCRLTTWRACLPSSALSVMARSTPSGPLLNKVRFHSSLFIHLEIEEICDPFNTM